MNKSLVCRVLVPRNKGNPAISTGYAIKAGIVMLSHHALLDDNRDRDQPIILIWESIADPEAPENLFQCNSKKEHTSECNKYDLAFIECDTPPSTPVNLCYLACQKFPADKKWESYGYPRAKQLEEEIDYPPTTVGGKARSSNKNGLIELDSTDMESPEEWAGISGAPIFFGSLLAGIIVEKPEPHKNRLEGRSLAFILEKDDSFSKLLQIPNHTEEEHLQQTLDIIESKDVFSILSGLLSHQDVDSKQIYSYLLSLSIGEFLEKIVDLQELEQYSKQKTMLSNLVFSLLPHFIDNMVRDGAINNPPVLK